MSAPLFLVDALPAADRCTLAGPEGRHAADVLRLRPGEAVLLGDGRGGFAEGVVAGTCRGEVDIAVTGRRRIPQARPRLVVAQGLPKGDRGELAVQAMTEVGVDEVVPWAAARSVTVWRDARGAKAHARWAATGREAAKQARRPWLPQVAPQATTAQLCGRLAAAAAAYVLHEEADARLSAAPLPGDGEVVLVVGPEGGVAEPELAAFAAAGALPVRLGAQVLRTSTAGVAALAVLNVRLGRW